jgi:hypothetical protein
MVLTHLVEHLREIRATLDDQTMPVRGGVAVGALVAVPLLGTGVRRAGTALDLGEVAVPLLVVAHVPAVIALIAIWSIGCDVCR